MCRKIGDAMADELLDFKEILGRGYGFITGEDGNDYFLHISAIESFAGVYPVRGQKVEYGEIYDAPKGKEARHVILVEQ